MSRYSVAIARRAIKSIAGLPPKQLSRIRAAIDLLAEQPRPPDSVALSGEHSVYRVRVGDYRILHEIVDTRLLILVIRVGHRREVIDPVEATPTTKEVRCQRRSREDLNQPLPEAFKASSSVSSTSAARGPQRGCSTVYRASANAAMPIGTNASPFPV